MGLTINQQFAKIGLKIVKPKLTLERIPPELKMERKPGKLEIRSPRPVLHIDQTESFADAGLMTSERFHDYYAQVAYSDALSGIARRVQEGKALSKFEKGMNIGRVAWNRLNPGYKFANVRAIPKQPPKTYFEVSPVEISYEAGTIVFEFIPGRIESNFQWGSVEVYMQQMNSIDISWEEEEQQVDIVI
ncbi:MAG: DUF6470 family protein [Syntrophomonadaceae bacterium]|jgi:hypothetical protein|nr:DUF6470 family protein [Syntrophomonadaceae bacterium]